MHNHTNSYRTVTFRLIKWGWAGGKKMNSKLSNYRLLQAAIVIAFFGASNASIAKAVDSKSREVSIMTYNVENLFDEHQDNKDDTTYIPLSQKHSAAHKAECMKVPEGRFRDDCMSLDWNTKIIQTKLERIAAVVASIDHGNGPDILILDEIENVRILGRLMVEINKKLPADKAYLEPILLEGWDSRGIDVGMLSRLPKAQATSITPVKMNGKILNSRGILHSVFRLPDGKSLNVFGVHFPSGGNPVVMRKAAIDALNAELAKLSPTELAIAGGDYNINAKEQNLYAQNLGSKWLVSHMIGCKDCVGTEYFGRDNEWSFLDALLFTKNMKTGTSGWVVDEQSIDVPNDGPEQTWKGRPNRFSQDHGVSDHWPMFAKIRTK